MKYIVLSTFLLSSCSAFQPLQTPEITIQPETINEPTSIVLPEDTKGVVPVKTDAVVAKETPVKLKEETPAKANDQEIVLSKDTEVILPQFTTISLKPETEVVIKKEETVVLPTGTKISKPRYNWVGYGMYALLTVLTGYFYYKSTKTTSSAPQNTDQT